MTTATAEDRERVGPYRVIQAIGAGGSARIDLARIDRAYGFQRHVVIKRPLEHLRSNAKVAASLRREARIGGQLRHPNLVAILDAGIHDGYDYLVLEYVHGAALRALMQTEAPGTVRELPLAVALAIVTDVARGMHEAHELTDDLGSPLGLVHRDVSPGNILLGLDGTVKLADFGIAKETRVSTLSGSMHGTVTYMAPEQCQGHAFDRRADVFSLGVILYELVTGTRLFWADNDVASLHRVLSGTVPRPRKIKPDVPSALEDILMVAVAHDAGQRYPTALDLANALERYAADAGEVIGARWIARTMEEVVGARQVPWIAAATVPEVTPRGDGSLVDLIAATGPDEPVPPSFGDAGDAIDEPRAVAIEPRAVAIEPRVVAIEPRAVAIEPRAVAIDEPSAEAIAEPRMLASREPVVPARRTPRRRRTLVVGLIALTVIGGSAATAILITRGSDLSATSAVPPPTNARPQPASPAPLATSAAPPPAPPAPPPQSPALPAASAVPPEQPIASPPPARDAAGDLPLDVTQTPAPLPITEAAPAAGPHATVVKKKPRPHAASKALPHVTGEAKGSDRDAAQPDAAAPIATDSGAGSAQPSVKAPANVEWKPTLLLPTDGSGAKNPK